MIIIHILNNVVINNYQQLNSVFISFWATRINFNLQALNKTNELRKTIFTKSSLPLEVVRNIIIVTKILV